MGTIDDTEDHKIDINKIYNKPQSELTTREIEALIEYKKELIEKRNSYNEDMERIRQLFINSAGDWSTRNSVTKIELNKRETMAKERYNNASV